MSSRRTRPRLLWSLWGALLLLLSAPALAAGAGPEPAAGECGAEPGGAVECMYRSLLPSVGIRAVCRSDRDCRVGYYYGALEDAVWFSPPDGLSTFPRPAVFWLTATLAQVRFDCGPQCTVSYFLEARRRRLSGPRRGVLAADHRRLLLAAAEDRTLVIRQVFSGREVLRIERDWAPGLPLDEALPALSFDPDGRLSFTWLRGPAREPVSERLTVPSY